jgi:hypothetical protein
MYPFKHMQPHATAYHLQFCVIIFITNVTTLALSSWPRQKLGKVWAINHIHILGNVGECEGMSPHTPKWIPTLGVTIPMDFGIFK